MWGVFRIRPLVQCKKCIYLLRWPVTEAFIDSAEAPAGAGDRASERASERERLLRTISITGVQGVSQQREGEERRGLFRAQEVNEVDAECDCATQT